MHKTLAILFLAFFLLCSTSFQASTQNISHAALAWIEADHHGGHGPNGPHGPHGGGC